MYQVFPSADPVFESYQALNAHERVEVYCCAPNAPALIPFAREWANLGMGWVEDPFGFDDFDEVSAVAAALHYPVGVGEEQGRAFPFRQPHPIRYIGGVRLGATTCGGVTGFVSIAEFAARAKLSRLDVAAEADIAGLETFMEASISAAMIIAHADGKADLAERRRIISFFRSNPLLHGFSAAAR